MNADVTFEACTVIILDGLGVIDRIFELASCEEVQLWFFRAGTTGHNAEVEQGRRDALADQTLH